MVLCILVHVIPVSGSASTLAPRPPNNCVLLGRGRVIVSKPVAPMMGLLHSTDPDDAGDGDDDEDDDDDDEDDGKDDDEGNGDEMVMIMFPNCSCTTGGAFALRRPTFGHSDTWTYLLNTWTYLPLLDEQGGM